MILAINGASCADGNLFAKLMEQAAAGAEEALETFSVVGMSGRTTLAELVREVMEKCDALPAPVTLVGLSLGGLLAALCASHPRVKRVVLINPMLPGVHLCVGKSLLMQARVAPKLLWAAARGEMYALPDSEVPYFTSSSSGWSDRVDQSARVLLAALLGLNPAGANFRLGGEKEGYVIRVKNDLVVPERVISSYADFGYRPVEGSFGLDHLLHGPKNTQAALLSRIVELFGQ